MNCNNASWCKICWKVQNSRLPFAVCSFSLNFLTTPAFFPIIDGPPSVARLTAGDPSVLTRSRDLMRPVKISSAVVVSIIGTNSTNSLVMVKVSLSLWLNMANCATSVMALLLSIATGNKINYITLYFSWLSKSAETSKILSAIFFLVLLIFATAWRFYRHTSSAAYSIHVFTNSSSLNDFAAIAI